MGAVSLSTRYLSAIARHFTGNRGFAQYAVEPDPRRFHLEAAQVIVGRRMSRGARADGDAVFQESESSAVWSRRHQADTAGATCRCSLEIADPHSGHGDRRLNRWRLSRQTRSKAMTDPERARCMTRKNHGAPRPHPHLGGFVHARPPSTRTIPAPVVSIVRPRIWAASGKRRITHWGRRVMIIDAATDHVDRLLRSSGSRPQLRGPSQRR